MACLLREFIYDAIIVPLIKKAYGRRLALKTRKVSCQQTNIDGNVLAFHGSEVSVLKLPMILQWCRLLKVSCQQTNIDGDVLASHGSEVSVLKLPMTLQWCRQLATEVNHFFTPYDLVNGH
ncbi:hypothetical protein Nepgr_024386 [Nepenthes gracilis]|uniref:Uncharacterized protein n=1 Tax=Nepenthes gracilis TaxID=150966 RepID=A0AAD3XYR6_NEPGR|nr:hypothetical protein Nepgr_024386 [Nepenthes gracilis]